MKLDLFRRKRRDVEYYSARFEALWRELVPPVNQVDTKQGELVRCIGNLRDESERIGNPNWDELNEQETAYLLAHLPDLSQFDEETCHLIRSDLERIQAAGRSGHGAGEAFENYFRVQDEVFERLMHRVVDWCHAHPQPIELRPRDPDIRRFE